jgi:hypothetical protein
LAACGCGAVALMLPSLLQTLPHARHAGDFYAYRAVPLFSGVSPLCPLLLLAAVAAAGALTQLAARRYAEFPGCRVRAHHGAGLAALAGLLWVLLSTLLLNLAYMDTPEGRVYDSLFASLMGGAYWCTAFAATRLFQLLFAAEAQFHQIDRAALQQSILPIESAGFWKAAGEESLRIRSRQLERESGKGPLWASLRRGIRLESLVAAARRQAYFLALAVVLLMAVFQWYPFQPAERFSNYIAATFLVCGGAIAVAYFRLARHYARSPLYKDPASGITWEGAVKFITVVVVPLVFLLASIFPQYTRLFYGWLVPALSAVK